MKKYTITCDEVQLRLIADAVEDYSRLLSGQCELNNMSLILRPIKNIHKLEEIMREQVHPLVTPELPLNASYSWNGGNCPNKIQRIAIAMGYGIYREIRHFFACQRTDNNWNCYKSETLRCPEQGELIQIKEIKEE